MHNNRKFKTLDAARKEIERLTALLAANNIDASAVAPTINTLPANIASAVRKPSVITLGFLLLLFAAVAFGIGCVTAGSAIKKAARSPRVAAHSSFDDAKPNLAKTQPPKCTTLL